MLDFPQEGIREISRRFLFGYVAVGILFVFMAARLFMLQIVRGDFFWILSSEHTVKEIRNPATRGIVYDRRERPLVWNRPSFDLAVVPQYIRDRNRLMESLERLAHVSPEAFSDRWRWVKKLPPYYPLRVTNDLSPELAAQILVRRVTSLGPSDPFDLRGVEIIPRPLRRYPQPIIAASLLGYLGEVSPENLAGLQEKYPGRYFLGDLVGVTGIEKQWEPYLKGEDGFRQKVVDATGREVSSEDVRYLLGDLPPAHGNNFVLTIDAELQQYAEELLQGEKGGIVAIDPRTGEILVWASLPTFDPSRLGVNVDREYWRSVVQDPEKPFLNRVIQAYPPGSVFKVVTAIAALEEKETDWNEEIYCPGGMTFGKRFFRCWREGGHGRITLREALYQSCDTFFYKLGIRLGVDRLARYARGLGFGRPTGVKMESEKNGFIPTTRWKKETFGLPWYPGEDLSVAVGQGAVMVTPLQAALLMVRVAGGGEPVHPRLIKEIVRREEGEGEKPADFAETPEEGQGEIPVRRETWVRIRESLALTVADPRGTAYGSRSSRISIGGKTGTAQVISEEGRERAGFRESLKDHAWFVAFAPAEDPRIVVGVFVENGGFGASAAAPRAKKLIEKFSELYPERKQDAPKPL